MELGRAYYKLRLYQGDLYSRKMVYFSERRRVVLYLLEESVNYQGNILLLSWECDKILGLNDY